MAELTPQPTKLIKSILISLPRPDAKSPYFVLEEKYAVKIDFKSFTEVQGLSQKDFRKHRVNPPDYSAIIFTSRNAITHFFRLCEEMRIRMSQETKYFCITEAIALYLQKYVQYRKRKVFFPKGDRRATLEEVLKKHRKEENFFLPCAANGKGELTDFMKDNNFKFDEAPMYESVAADLSDLNLTDYDMIAFFSPAGIDSLLKSFPDFQQNDMLIGAFGPATCQTVTESNLRLDIKAPSPEAPSMVAAIDAYLKNQSGT
jgi:uroporphyrinogen-III synthase